MIGGGIMGASTAYHLARRGCTDVVVLESGEMFGLGSTGLNAGGIRYQFATKVNIELSKVSIGMMETFRRRDGAGSRSPTLRLPLHARPRGRSRAIPSERRAAELARRAEPSRQRSGDRRACAGSRHRAASSAARGVRSTASSIRMDCCKGTCPTRGGSARRCSPARRPSASMSSGGRVRRVVTKAGSIETPTVVIAGGSVVGADRRDGRNRSADSTDSAPDRRHGTNPGSASRIFRLL